MMHCLRRQFRFKCVCVSVWLWGRVCSPVSVVCSRVLMCVCPQGLCQFFKNNRLMDRERGSLQENKEKYNHNRLKCCFFSLRPSLDLHCSPSEAQRVTAGHFSCSGLFSPSVFPLHMICVKLLRFSAAAARWYRWKEPLQPISYSVIREGCVGYWQLLHTTEYIIAGRAAKVEIANI